MLIDILNFDTELEVLSSDAMGFSILVILLANALDSCKIDWIMKMDLKMGICEKIVTLKFVFRG